MVEQVRFAGVKVGDQTLNRGPNSTIVGIAFIQLFGQIHFINRYKTGSVGVDILSAAPEFGALFTQFIQLGKCEFRVNLQ